MKYKKGRKNHLSSPHTETIVVIYLFDWVALSFCPSFFSLVQWVPADPGHINIGLKGSGQLCLPAGALLSWGIFRPSVFLGPGKI